MRWSDSAWKEAEHIYNAILQLPFVRELADGSLDRRRFEFYITQDAIYLDNYSRVLAHIASRIPSKKHSEDFLRFALDGVMVEKELHRSFLSHPLNDTEPSPTCLQYMNFELSKSNGPVEIETAAVLPCFWIYQRVGSEIIRNSNSDNPYKRWIDTYADDSFAAATARAIDICDELAQNTTQHIRNLMTRAFVYASKMEWMFWDSAYNFEQWKI